MKIIEKKFEYDAVICLMGEFPGENTVRKFIDKPLIAADGAGKVLLEHGIMPDYVVGDGDSFGECEPAKNFPSERFVKDPDQETNDFEKCLIFSFHKCWNRLLIIGFSGGLLEHTLNNWSVLKKYSATLQLAVYEHGRISYVLQKGKYEFHAKAGELISLIPQPSAVVTTHNLSYPLKNERLELGYREGARNVFAADYATVEIVEGEVLAFIPAD